MRIPIVVIPFYILTTNSIKSLDRKAYLVDRGRIGH